MPPSAGVEISGFVMDFVFTYSVPFLGLVLFCVLIFAGALVWQLFRAARLLRDHSAIRLPASGSCAAEPEPDRAPGEEPDERVR
jgi:hypothetical protein